MRSNAAVVALVVCLNACLWVALRGSASAPDVDLPLASVSYAPYAAGDQADEGARASAERIRDDLSVLAPLARAVRTYSSTEGVEQVAGIAGEFGLKATVGAWVDGNQDRNERELESVIDLARRHSNVSGIVVGNEAIFRGEVDVQDLIGMIRRVKRSTSVPVTTGEIWHVWLEHPELVSAVDYIAAHILPYWEGFEPERAVEHAISIYNRLREAYPGKRIVIAEFGWPSAGLNNKSAVPGRLVQGTVIRSFAAEASRLGIDYNIVEAIDQPWKVFEGSVGPYWGLLDADRNEKFSWSGTILERDHWHLAALAVALGFLLSIPVLAIRGATVFQSAFLAVAGNATGTWLASIAAYWQGHYFVPGAAFAFGVGVLLMVPLVLIVLARIEEIAAVAFGLTPHRLLEPQGTTAPDAFAPMVSIHVPAYRERPEMLIRTLDSVARLDYPNLECVVVINNTPDPAFWQPVEEHCRTLGDRFKFIRVDNLSGYKAGALRLALEHTSPAAEIVGVIDADYEVTPNWLADLVPAFADPRVGLVQAPQDHRDGDRSPLHSAMNAEYAGFFDIGMVQRNEVDAIVVHGTMCLIRRSALEAAGGWSSDTICEDTDLGLTLTEQGWRSHYTRLRYGFGLLPDTYEAFKKQRHRWAYGGFQIIKKHWRRFMPGASRLDPQQKRAFAVGWIGWLGAESLGVAVALLNLVCVPMIIFFSVAVPSMVLTVPILASTAVSLLHFAALYRLRCKVSGGAMMGALLAAMSVQWTIASAVATGLVKDHLPFVVTAKGGNSRKRQVSLQASWEAVIGLALVAGAAALLATNTAEVREINVFAAILVLQSLPFLSAVALSWLEASRLNDYAQLAAIEQRLARLVPRGRSARPLETLAADTTPTARPEA